MYQAAIILATLVALSTGFLIDLPTAAFPKQAEKCDQTKSVKCFAEFSYSLDIPDSVTNAAEFFKYLKQYVNKNGGNGFVGLCSAGLMLHICEGKQYDDCTSVEAFEQLGANETDAYTYASFVGQLDYECGPGYDAFYQNGECILKVSNDKDYQKYEAQCLETMSENIKKDPNNVCEYFQEFASCLSNPVKKYCGKPAAFAFCNTVISGFTKVSDNCDDLNCDYLR